VHNSSLSWAASRSMSYSATCPFRCQEALDYDVDILDWDGTHLCFSKRDAADADCLICEAQVVAGRLTGTIASGAVPLDRRAWSGTRASVLSFGFCPKPQAQRAAWQASTRRMYAPCHPSK
jgi:hypothetical protein